MKYKHFLILFVFSIFSNYGFGQNSKNNDEVVTFKSDGYDIYKLDVEKKAVKDSVTSVEGVINYHKINFKEKTISWVAYNNKNNRWESFDLKFKDINKEDWGTEYIIENNGCLTISYEDEARTLLYNLVNQEIYSYNNLV